MSVRYAAEASMQRTVTRPRALCAVLGATPPSRDPPFVRMSARLEASRHSLALRLERTARSVRRGPSSSRKACPSAACVQLAALRIKRGQLNVNYATTILSVIALGRSLVPLVRQVRWHSPREATSVPSQYLAILDSTALPAMALIVSPALQVAMVLCEIMYVT